MPVLDPSRSPTHEHHLHNHEDSSGPLFDLICVGFGPASLAVAVALQDLSISAKVLFLERQSSFAWHAGMLIPGARMQISFLKDLATFRDPRSYYTFLNYLKCKNRLEAFANLGTFLPVREEFNDYLAWAASHFEDQVLYSAEVTGVSPSPSLTEVVESWDVSFWDMKSSKTATATARHVVIGLGGTPRLPCSLQSLGSRVVHSSNYLFVKPELLVRDEAAPQIAVIGGAQSAAEVFDDLTSRYPRFRITMYITDFALRPSDDSPFVNEIFDSGRVDDFYNLPLGARKRVVAENRGTNYSVVRSDLIDRLHEKLYRQRLHYANEEAWPHRIVGLSKLDEAEVSPSGRLTLRFSNPRLLTETVVDDIDLVIAGTGYARDAHKDILKGVAHLMEGSSDNVERSYKLKMLKSSVSPNCGIWLQGCCEASHGISDTLLSILAVRGGELVQSIFGSQLNPYERSALRSSEILTNGSTVTGNGHQG